MGKSTYGVHALPVFLPATKEGEEVRKQLLGWNWDLQTVKLLPLGQGKWNIRQIPSVIACLMFKWIFVHPPETEKESWASGKDPFGMDQEMDAWLFRILGELQEYQNKNTALPPLLS